MQNFTPTYEETIEMLKEKQTFIKNLNKVFKEGPAGSSVIEVKFEAYKKEFSEAAGKVTFYEEFLVVTFKGGTRSVRRAGGNSNHANFRELGALIDGGYYSELDFYQSLEANGYEKIL